MPKQSSSKTVASKRTTATKTSPLAKTPIVPVGSYTLSKRAGSPVPAQRAGLPITGQRAGSPVPAQRAGLPITGKRAGSPVPAQRAGLPITGQRAGSPVPAQRAGLPVTGQRAGSPVPAQRAGLPVTGQRAVSPLGQRVVAPMTAQRAVSPLGERVVVSVPTQRAVSPLPGQRTIAPVPAQRAVSPLPGQRTIAPVPAQRAVSPLGQRTIAPVPAQRAVSPLGQRVVATGRKTVAAPVSPRKPVDLKPTPPVVSPSGSDALLRFADQGEIQFNLYSDHVYLVPGKNKIVFQSVASRSVAFEVRTPNRPAGEKYITRTFPTKWIVEDWNVLFPINQAQPNAYINGFDDNGDRKLLTMTISQPEIQADSIIFTYRLDTFEGDLNIDPNITQWDGKEPLHNVSLMIDGALDNAKKWLSVKFSSAVNKYQDTIKKIAYSLVGKSAIACKDAMVSIYNQQSKDFDNTFSLTQLVGACAAAAGQTLKDEVFRFYEEFLTEGKIPEGFQ